MKRMIHAILWTVAFLAAPRTATSAEVVVRVSGPNGEPFSGVQVWIGLASEYRRTIHQNADNSGIVRFDGLQPGHYEISAHSSVRGYLPTRTFFAIVPGTEHQEEELRFLGGPGAHGRVLDESKRPLPRARLQLSPISGSDEGRRSILMYTDEQGGFRLYGLSAEKWFVYIEAADGRKLRASFLMGDTELAQDLHGQLIEEPGESGTITAKVIDFATGDPVRHFGVLVYADGKGDMRYYGSTDWKDGIARIEDLRPGRYLLSFPNGDYVTTRTPVVLNAGAQQTIDVVVGKGANVAFRVHLHGDPVQAAKVVLYELDDGGDRANDLPPDERETDIAGRGFFRGVSRGRWDLVVELEEGDDARSSLREEHVALNFDEKNGSNLELDVDLDLARYAGSVAFTVRAKRFTPGSIELYACTVAELLSEDVLCDLVRGAYAENLGSAFFEHLEPRTYAAELVLTGEGERDYCVHANVRIGMRGRRTSVVLDDARAERCAD